TVPSSGEIATVTTGPTGTIGTHALIAVSRFRGLGVATVPVGTVKSEPLLFVSVQPLSLLKAAIVLLRVGAAEAPSKKFAWPEPTRAMMGLRATALQTVELPLHPSEVVMSTSATLPAPAAIFI